MNADDARAYLRSLSAHPDRAGDTALLHPDLAVRLATAIQQARNEGMQVGLLSGVRAPTDHPSAYDLAGDSSHEYGLAADVSGIGPAGSSTSARWRQIAEANGLSSPYDPNGGEWNHWQIGPKLETNPTLLASLKQAKTTGNPQDMWSAFDAGGGSTVAQGPDNRQIFFDALTKNAGLTPQQALGALWSIGGESHPNIDTTSSNPNDPNGGAFGALQWQGPRRWPLEEIAQHRGVSATDPHLQAEYMVGELTGNLQGAQLQPGVLEALKQAKTPEEAARIWTSKMERPLVDNSEQRIANGSAVGSLDANGNFVPGTAKATPAIASAGTRAGGAAAASPVYAPPSPQAMLGSSIGQALAGMGQSMSTPSGGGSYMDTSGDQPAIRSMAAQTDFTSPANPLPAQFAGGSGGVGSQLGLLSAQPAMTPLENPNEAPSITQGAPSMTAMLGALGTNAAPSLFDQRSSALSPNPYRPTMRLA